MRGGTFRQFPLGSDRLGLLTADGGAAAAYAAHHRHGVIITTSLQRVPVGDKW